MSFIPGVFADGSVTEDLQGTEGQTLEYDASGRLRPAAASAAGNLDGGQADTNYGGTTPIDGGNA